MKKIMTIAAAAAAMLAVADGVESGIVGYKQVDVSAGQFVGLGVQLNDVTSVDTIAVKDLVSVSDPRGANGLVDSADQIWKWENSAWTKYFYRVRGTTTYGWIKYDSSASTQSSTVTTDTLGNGESVFFKRSTAGGATLMLQGAVNTTVASVATTVAAGQFAQISNPWPMEMSITDIGNCIPAADRKGANGLVDTADQIWIWENSAWTKYFYRVRGTTTYGWIKYDSSASTQSSTPTTDTVGVGQGFFFKRSTAAGTTITFVKPDSL